MSAGTGLLSAIALIAAFVVVALGVLVNPGTRRRLHRRHDPSAFGRVRSVDRRTIRSAEDCTERCVERRARIERGLVRRYREEHVVAGLPVYTSSIGYNHYCLECATVGGKVPDAGPSTGDAATDRDELLDDPSLERR